MNRCLILLFFQLSSHFLLAQANNFAPVGATWFFTHYFHIVGLPQTAVNYTKITSVSDTVIAGKKCSILRIDSAYIHAAEYPDPVYVYSDSNKVYQYFAHSGKLGLQYDFNAFSGDTIICYSEFFNGEFAGYFPVVIDSTDSLLINEISLKRWKYRSLDPNFEMDQWVIQNIGGTEFLFTKYTVAEDQSYGLRCYSDPLIGFYNTGLVSSCDTTYIISGLNNLPSSEIKIYPTPFSAEISIQNATNFDITLQVLDSYGDSMTEKIIPRHSLTEINSLNWIEGMYVLFIDFRGKHYSQKVLKVNIH